MASSSRRAPKRPRHANLAMRDVPSDPWAGKPVACDRSFDIDTFRQNQSTAWSVQQLEARGLLGICNVTEPAYPRIVRVFYQNMYTSDEAPGALLSVVDGVELAVTPESIAEVLHCSLDTLDEAQFPVFPRQLTIPELIAEYYEGRQDDDNRTSIRRANIPRRLLFLDVVLKRNVIPLGHKEERRGDFIRTLHKFDFGFWVDLPTLIFNQMARILNEVKVRHTRGSATWALPFGNLITALIKGQGTYPFDPHEEQLPMEPPYGRTDWRKTTTRLPAPLVIPGAPDNPNADPEEPAAAPAPMPFRMTRAQYQTLLDNQAAIQQSVEALRTDYQAYRDYSQTAFDQLNARQVEYQQSVASLQTDFYASRELNQQHFDQLGNRVHDEAFETRTLMHALFDQYFPPPPQDPTR